MVYTIGGLVQFRSEDGAVWVSEDIGVTLTVTTSRLLEYLLLHRGRVIFRDEILQNVWDAHGLKTSGNSLNKYISDLRSAFRNLGFQQELIVTVPKVGFMIAEGVHIEAEEREEKKRAVNLPATAQESEPHRERLRRVSVLLLGGSPCCFWPRIWIFWPAAIAARSGRWGASIAVRSDPCRPSARVRNATESILSPM
ncbi:winged helix-turn-helix domain-containing protein [Pluralibacter gergoviae]|uniref:winged helix-turn-helix domain-containing protein n=1 Tax=Pluralibacter gergoviae TaxID=61647 RepID=UPI00092EA34F|nr:helix-turn-helix domain-containing protein [Pluralibacter gergoviae]